MMKVREDDPKKQKIRKPRTLKPPSTVYASGAATQHVHWSIDEVEAGTQSLQSTIDMVKRIVNGYDSSVDSD